MSRIRSRLNRLERRGATRPACPCLDPNRPVKFVVAPLRVIGEPYDAPPPAPPRPCERCGRPSKDMRFVVKPPRAIGAGAAS
jgi:hypothetical protein